MVSPLYLVTTNLNKAQVAKFHLAPFEIELILMQAELVEPQADTVEQVAAAKAKQAYTLLQVPVLVEDSGFLIDALHGFPGPYTKYVLQTLGVHRLLMLASSLPSRTCRFQSVLAYTESVDSCTTFADNAVGTFADEVDTPSPAVAESAWSDLWRIFIPQGHERVLTAMSEAERQSIFQRWQQHSNYHRFGQWFVSRRSDVEPGG